MYGRIIRYYRKLRGLTQAELASLINVSEKTISSWEVDRTEPNMEAVEHLSVVLEIPKSVLVGEELTPEKLSSKEMAILLAYRTASRELRSAVEAVLKVE